MGMHYGQCDIFLVLLQSPKNPNNVRKPVILLGFGKRNANQSLLELIKYSQNAV